MAPQETLTLTLTAEDNASDPIAMIGAQLTEVADEADNAMASIEGVNGNIQQTGADAQAAGDEGTAALLPLAGVFGAIGSKIGTALPALAALATGVGVLAGLTSIFKFWRANDEALDAFRLSLLNAGVGVENIDGRLRELRDTIQFTTLGALREAGPRIQNIFALLPLEAQKRVDELGDILGDLGILSEADAITFATTLEVGTPEFGQFEDVAQGLGISEGAVGLSAVLDTGDAQGRVEALNDYIGTNVLPNLGAFTTASLAVDDALTRLGTSISNTLEGPLAFVTDLFANLVNGFTDGLPAVLAFFQPVTNIAGAIVDFAGSVFELLGALGGLLLSLPIVGDFLRFAWDQVTGFFGAIAAGIRFMPTLIGWLTQAVDWLTEFVNSVREFDFGEAVSGWLSALANLAVDIYNIATNWAVNLWNGLLDGLGGLVSDVGGFFGDVFDDVFGGLFNGREQIGPDISPVGGGYNGPQTIEVNLNADGERLGRVIVGRLDQQFGRQVPGTL